MLDHIGVLQTHFESLEKSLAALVQLYASDPEATFQLERVRAAQEKAAHAATLLRKYQQGQ